MKIALKKSTLRKTCRITVFSDSQTALRQFQGFRNSVDQALRTQNFKRAKQFYTRGKKLIVRWIPSHKAIKEKKQADKTAKKAAANERCQMAWWSFLTHVNRKIKQAKKLEVCSWHQARNKERETRNRTATCNRMVMTDIYFPLPTNAQSTDPFLFLHFCIISPPVLHRQGLAFGLPALLILSFAIRVTCCQVVPLLLGPPSGHILPPYLLLSPDPLPP